MGKLNATQEEWKLRAMGTTIGCHTIVKKVPRAILSRHIL